jgi:chromate transporter
MRTSESAPPPNIGAWKLLTIFTLIGIQSFGGGSATLLLIRRAMVNKRNWISEDEFTRYFALCQIAPGINLIALCILIGNKLAKFGGIMACLAGMLLPSVIITALLTAGFSVVQTWTPMQAALKGIVPATAGLSLVLAWELARPLLKQSYSEAKSSLAVSVGLIVSAAFLLAFLHLPVIFVLLIGALGGMLILARYERVV